MKNNTVTAYNGVEVYTSKITELAEQYINYELTEERKQEIYTNNSICLTCLFTEICNLDESAEDERGLCKEYQINETIARKFAKQTN